MRARSFRALCSDRTALSASCPYLGTLMVRTRFQPVSSLSFCFGVADELLSAEEASSPFSSSWSPDSVGFGVSDFCGVDVDVDMKAAGTGARESKERGEPVPIVLIHFPSFVAVE